MLFDTIESEAEAQTDLTTERTTISRHPGGGGARAAARAPPRGRWGPRRKPRAHHPPSGRVNQPRAAEQSAPPSAAACTAGRKTDGPLSGAAAPGGGGRPEADPAARLPHHSGFNAIHPVTRPATHFWDKKPSLAAAAPPAVPPRSDPAPSPEAGEGEAHSGRMERGHHMGQSNGRPPACDPYTDPRKQLDELLKARLSNEEFTRQLAQLRCELLTARARLSRQRVGLRLHRLRRALRKPLPTSSAAAASASGAVMLGAASMRRYPNKWEHAADLLD